MDNLTHEKPIKVFISYASADRAVVSRIAVGLREGGVNVALDAWELAYGDSIEDRIDVDVRSSDVFLIILSKASIASRWLKRELNSALVNEMTDRGITIIPALIEECDIPDALAGLQYMDLRGDVATGTQQLVRQL